MVAAAAVAGPAGVRTRATATAGRTAGVAASAPGGGASGGVIRGGPSVASPAAVEATPAAVEASPAEAEAEVEAAEAEAAEAAAEAAAAEAEAFPVAAARHGAEGAATQPHASLSVTRAVDVCGWLVAASSARVRARDGGRELGIGMGVGSALECEAAGSSRRAAS